VTLTLGQLCAPWPDLVVEAGSGLPIESVIADSRQARPGALFVAARGSGADGHDFCAQAVAGGCSAVALLAAERGRLPEAGRPGAPAGLIVAGETVGLAGLLARELHVRPDERLVVAAVTGTNGKTTVAFLVRQMLSTLVGRCGLIGTIYYANGRDQRPAALTTPGGPQLYGLLAEMVDNECRAVALEASSHALEQRRTAGLTVDVAVFTNLGRDHLDYHGDLARYLAAKCTLLDLLAPGPLRAKAPGRVALNVGDPTFTTLDTGGLATVRFDAVAADPATKPARPADLRVTDSELSMTGTRIELAYHGQTLVLTSPLVGRFNVENLTAALAAGLALGYDPDDCTTALAGVQQVPGRLERIDLPGGGLAVVDYAHTHDALAAVLTTCRELTDGRLIVVFGCGGDRDRGKRPLMGAVAALGADVVWITSDNPRSENPASICTEIAEGFDAQPEPLASGYRIVVDRREAIEAALATAGAGDIVVIAGKGHEDYQLVRQQRLDLDDRQIVHDWIERRGSDD